MPLQEKELRNILNVPTVACALVIGVSHALFFTSARPHYFRNPPLRSELVPALQRAGLHMVYASEARLLLEADRLKLPMELDAEQLEEQDKAMNVQLQEKGLVFLLDKDAAGCDVPITGTAADLGIPSIQYPTLLSPFPDSLKEYGRWIQTIFQPYEHIYAQFESPQRFPDGSPTKQARETLYKVQPATGSVLHGNDILTLLTSIIEGPVATCARLNMGKLISQGHVEAMFPGHRAQERRRLMEKWNHWAVLPWNQPFSEIRAYLGERIALYFAFLGYLSATLLVPAVLGVAVFANQVLADQPYLSWLPAFALVVITWATLLMVGWKHKQQVYGVKWGSVDVDDSTRRRPEYIESKAVHQRRSFVTGKQEYWADPLWQRVRRGTSMSIVTLAVGTVVVVIVSLFSARVLLEQEERKGNLDEGWGGYLASFLTAVQIQLCGFLYSSLAKFLTDLETHETDASYTDSLSGKRAAFELVNSNFSLFWVAFVKGNRFVIFGEEQTCTLADSGRPDCLAELQSHLAILFITRIVVNNLQELLVPMVVPYVMAFIKACTASEEEQGRGVDGLPLGEMSVMELEASKPEYDVADDWLEIVIVLSYCMFFVVAFPL
ncbi:ANO7, partial [Symbiodinium sp. KB8]